MHDWPFQVMDGPTVTAFMWLLWLGLMVINQLFLMRLFDSPR